MDYFPKLLLKLVFFWFQKTSLLILASKYDNNDPQDTIRAEPETVTGHFRMLYSPHVSPPRVQAIGLVFSMSSVIINGFGICYVTYLCVVSLCGLRSRLSPLRCFVSGIKYGKK